MLDAPALALDMTIADVDRLMNDTREKILAALDDMNRQSKPNI